MKKIVFCDICNTLYSKNTTSDFVSFLCKVNGVGVNNNKFLSLLEKLSYKLLKIDLGKKRQLKVLAGLKRSYLKDIAYQYVDYLDDFQIENTFSLLKDYKSKGYEIILVSATLDPVASEIAQRISAVFYSSKLSFTGDICDGFFESDLTYDKLENVNHLISSAVDVVTITDNLTDIKLIEASHKAYIYPYNKVSKWKSLTRKLKTDIKYL